MGNPAWAFVGVDQLLIIHGLVLQRHAPNVLFRRRLCRQWRRVHGNPSTQRRSRGVPAERVALIERLSRSEGFGSAPGRAGRVGGLTAVRRGFCGWVGGRCGSTALARYLEAGPLDTQDGAHAHTDSIGLLCWARLHREAANAPVPTVRATPWAGGWGGGPTTAAPCLLQQRSLAFLLIHPAVTLVGTDSSRPWRVLGIRDRNCMTQSRHPLQLTEDPGLVCKEIADQTVGVFLLHGQGCFHAWADNARRQGGSQSNNVFLVSRRQLYQACEVVHACVKSGNVGQSQLRECLLYNTNTARVIGCFRARIAVDGSDNLINVR